MSKFNAETEKMELATLYGEEVLFTDWRIDRNTIPNGLYLYEIRHSDEDGMEPVQLAKGILVNHYGTVLSAKEIKLDADGYRDMEEDDFSFSDKSNLLARDYLKSHPAEKKKEQEPQEPKKTDKER